MKYLCLIIQHILIKNLLNGILHYTTKAKNVQFKHLYFFVFSQTSYLTRLALSA